MNENENEYLNLRICGIDPHKSFCKAVVVDEKTLNTVDEFDFKNDRNGVLSLVKQLRALDCNQVVIENTNNFSAALYITLKRHGFKVASVNPALVPKKRKKSDRIDAKWVAISYLYKLVEEDYIPSAEIQYLRDLTRLRTKLVDMRSMLKNKVHALLTRADIHLGNVFSDIFGKQGLAILNSLADGLTDMVRNVKVKHNLAKQVKNTIENSFLELLNCSVLRILLSLIQVFNKEIKQLDQMIAAHIDEHERLKKLVRLMMSVPGVGFITAAIIVAEVGKFTRFSDAKKLVGWAGLAPQVSESAGKQKDGKITKRGSPYLRRALHEVANVITRSKRPKELYEFYKRVSGRSGQYKAKTALARKILAIIYHLVVQNEHFESRHEGYKQLHERKVKQFENLSRAGRDGLANVANQVDNWHANAM